jgi:hypothetical protein
MCNRGHPLAGFCIRGVERGVNFGDEIFGMIFYVFLGLVKQNCRLAAGAHSRPQGCGECARAGSRPKQH